MLRGKSVPTRKLNLNDFFKNSVLGAGNWWRWRQSHCYTNQWLTMRNADYAPTNTPKSIRLIKCLKSKLFDRSSGACHTGPSGSLIHRRHPALAKPQSTLPTVSTCALSSPSGETDFESRLQSSDNSAAITSSNGSNRLSTTPHTRRSSTLA